MFNRCCVMMLSVFLLSACGGGDTPMVITPVDNPPAPTIYMGVFLDSPVENLNFTTASGSGSTNNKGEFSYQLNENITFSIGAIDFPQVAAGIIITPLNIIDTQDINEVAVVNMLRFLQSLDIDGNADNGIQISNAAHDLAKELRLDFTDSDFDAKVANLVEMSGALNKQLITAEEAVYHFQQTLNDQNISSCEKTHSKVGHNGSFSTFAHNVSGKATIIDDCTIQITQFSYDGGGPEVYFYAAKNHMYSGGDAFSISQKINGRIYSDAVFLLRLPTNKTLDDLTGLSVWCADFNADFGNMEFTP